MNGGEGWHGLVPRRTGRRDSLLCEFTGLRSQGRTSSGATFEPSLRDEMRGRAHCGQGAGATKSRLQTLMVGSLLCLEERVGLLAGLGRCGNRCGLGAFKHRVRAARTLIEDNQAEGSAHEDDCRPSGEPSEDVGCGAGSKCGLRALTAESASEICRAALLQQDDADQEQAHNDVEDDNENKKDLHFLSCFPIPSRFRGQKKLWCGGGDLNPYASRRQHLKLVCLPISPPPH